MFKINQLKSVEKEEITIELIKHQSYIIDTKEKEEYDTLSFDVSGKIGDNNYSLTFDINCKLEELLKLEHSKTIEFNDYIFGSYLTVNDIADISPNLYITINRWLNNKFIILIRFYADILDDIEVYDTYSGIIEFEFNLDDYI